MIEKMGKRWGDGFFSQKRVVVAIFSAIILSVSVHLTNSGEFAKAGVDAFTGWLNVEDIPSELSNILFVKFPGATSFPLVFFGALYLFDRDRIRRLLARMWPDAPDFLNVDFENDEGKVDVFAQCPNFVGRLEELAHLENFTDDESQDQSWMLIEGRMGHGKSRTGREWLKRLKAEKWDAGVFNNTTDIERLQKANLRTKTAVLIDDAGDVPDIKLKLFTLIRRAQETGMTLKILLASQVQPYSIDIKMQDQNDEIVLSETRYAGLRLGALPVEHCRALASLIGLGSGKLGIEDIILNAQRRPLLLHLGENPWHELARRAQIRLELANSPAEKKLLALAALAGPFSNHGLPSDLKEIDMARRKRLFEGVKNVNLVTHIPALQPGAFAGELLLQWMDNTQGDVCDELIATAKTLNPVALCNRIGAMLESRPEKQLYEAVKLANHKGLELQDSDSKHPYVRSFARLIRSRPEHTEDLAEKEIVALFGDKSFPKVSNEMEITETRRRDIKNCISKIWRRVDLWPENESIQFMGAVSLLAYVGSCGDLDEINDLLFRVKKCANELALSERISEQIASVIALTSDRIRKISGPHSIKLGLMSTCAELIGGIYSVNSQNGKIKSLYATTHGSRLMLMTKAHKVRDVKLDHDIEFSLAEAVKITSSQQEFSHAAELYHNATFDIDRWSETAEDAWKRLKKYLQEIEDLHAKFPNDNGIAESLALSFYNAGVCLSRSGGSPEFLKMVHRNLLRLTQQNIAALAYLEERYPNRSWEAPFGVPRH